MWRYINPVKSRHGIGLPTTCGYHNFGHKIGFNFRAMFAQYLFALLVLHNIFLSFLVNFTILFVCLCWKEI